IFDSYKAMHKQWWENLKHLSLVQCYHALFLLALGWFIFGVPTPPDFAGLLVKLLIVIGGFSRLQNPPRILTGKLDNGGGFDEVVGRVKKTMDNTKRNIALAKGIITKNPKKILSVLAKDNMSRSKIVPVRDPNEGIPKEKPTKYESKGSYKSTANQKKVKKK